MYGAKTSMSRPSFLLSESCNINSYDIILMLMRFTIEDYSLSRTPRRLYIIAYLHLWLLAKMLSRSIGTHSRQGSCRSTSTYAQLLIALRWFETQNYAKIRPTSYLVSWDSFMLIPNSLPQDKYRSSVQAYYSSEQH